MQALQNLRARKKNSSKNPYMVVHKIKAPSIDFNSDSFNEWATVILSEPPLTHFIYSR